MNPPPLVNRSRAGDGVDATSLLPPLPPSSIAGEGWVGLTDHPHRARTTVTTADLLDGVVSGAVTSACRVSRLDGDDLVVRVLGIGDRRDVLLHGKDPLRALEAGTEIRSPDLRATALLRAHHPGLQAVPADEPPGAAAVDDSPAAPPPEVRPLWPDPGIESAGEVLEPESWLPAPGQGVAVLVHRPEAAIHFDGISSDAGAEAVLRAERAVGDAFPFAVPLVRAQLFGEWLSVHGIVLAPAGDRMVRARVRGHRGDPVGVGARLVEVLMARGGDLLSPPRAVP